MPDAGRVLTPIGQTWLGLICRCPNRGDWHACHHRAEQAAQRLGEPTARERELVEVFR